jgi:alcohol dehydrogenase class IV
MPDKVSVDTALDALVHAIESYVSPLASFITDMHALSAIEHVVVNLPLLVNDYNNMAYRTALSRASLEAGLAFSNASLGLVHAIAHSIGGYFNYLSHGELNGAFLKHVISYNYSASDKYKRVEEIFAQHYPEYVGQKLPEIVREFTQRITNALGEPLEVYDKGKSVTDTDIKRIAEVALNDPCVLTNPREPELDEVVEILEKVFKRGD